MATQTGRTRRTRATRPRRTTWSSRLDDRPERQGRRACQAGPQGQQQPAPAVPQTQLTDDDRRILQERQQQAWDAAAEREKSNNPATKKARTYDKNAPGMHPANQPDRIQDVEGHAAGSGGHHRQPRPPRRQSRRAGGQLDPKPDDKTGRIESINEPSHINQNMPPAGTVTPAPASQAASTSLPEVK